MDRVRAFSLYHIASHPELNDATRDHITLRFNAQGFPAVTWMDDTTEGFPGSMLYKTLSAVPYDESVDWKDTVRSVKHYHTVPPVVLEVSTTVIGGITTELMLCLRSAASYIVCL